MKNISKLSFILLGILSFCLLPGCFELDNMDAPNCTVKGRIIDKITGEIMPQQQPGGTKIRLEELSWSDDPEMIEFTVMNDGTFQFTRLYPGTYRIYAYGGPFVPQIGMDGTEVLWDHSDTIIVKNTTDVTIELEPYLRIEWAEENPVTLNRDSTLTVNFIVTRGLNPDRDDEDEFMLMAPQSVRLLISETPFLSNAGGSFSTYLTATTGIFDNKYNSNLNQVLTMSTANKFYTSSMTYYVRLAGWVDDNNFKQWNHSTVKTIVAPLPPDTSGNENSGEDDEDPE